MNASRRDCVQMNVDENNHHNNMSMIPGLMGLLSVAALAGPLRAQLCDLGCKCPEEGQRLAFLDCSRLGLSRLPPSLRLQPSVSRLSLRGNRLDSLHAGTFAPASRLQELDLSENALAVVQESAFAPLGSLSHLRLGRNRLSQLGPGLLQGLSELRLLDLGHNALQRLAARDFQDTPQLQELRLNGNPLFQLTEDAFRCLPALERLDLSDTGLARVPSLAFAVTPRLRWLSLAGNALERVPDEALSRATLLHSLDLSDNDFPVLGEGAFKRPSNISVLYLNNMNRLTSIERNALSGLLTLKSLSCSYNEKLSYVDPEAFATPENQLYLRQNALRTMKSPPDLRDWSALSFVDLGENPWRCDCQLLWMLKLKPETQASIKCSSPSSLQGRTLNTIKAYELGCDSTWTLAAMALLVATLTALCLIMMILAIAFCSRSPVGLYVRAKQQFSYAKVQPKTEAIDLEWDPSADM